MSLMWFFDSNTKNLPTFPPHLDLTIGNSSFVSVICGRKYTRARTCRFWTHLAIMGTCINDVHVPEMDGIPNHKVYLENLRKHAYQWINSSAFLILINFWWNSDKLSEI